MQRIDDSQLTYHRCLLVWNTGESRADVVHKADSSLCGMTTESG